MKIITDVLNRIMNAKMAGKTSCETSVSGFLLKVLDIMKKEGYVSYHLHEEDNMKKVVIDFNKLNECRVISPRFYVGRDSINKYVRRFLPSSDLGILIISTSKGLMTNKEAEENNIGGSLIAYCY